MLNAKTIDLKVLEILHKQFHVDRPYGKAI